MGDAKDRSPKKILKCDMDLETGDAKECSPFESLKNREWLLGDTKVKELYEYKNVGVLKNYVGSFSSNIDDNIDKTKKRVGMLFSSSFDRRKVNPPIYPPIYVKLYGAELFTLTPTLLLRLERCQSWFLKNIFTFPSLHLGLYF